MYCFSLIKLDLDEMLNDLHLKFKELQINNLCVKKGDSYSLLCFEQASALNCYLGQLWDFSHVYPNCVFDTLWMNKVNHYAETHGAMDLKSVIELILKPVFSECTEIHDQLLSCEIKLDEGDRFFKQYSANENSLSREIENLHQAVQKYLVRKPPNEKDVKTSILRLKQLWKISNCKAAAHAFLEIRDLLNLTGDFDPVLEIEEKVVDL